MAYFYIDYTYGTDTSPHTGLRIPAGDHNSTSYYVPDSVSGSPVTTVTDATLGSYATSALVGAYLYNVTLATGSYITANVTTTGVLTISPGISGMVATDSYYIIDSFKNISQFTSDGDARTAGDKCYVRANQTHTLAVTIVHDEDGTKDAYLSTIGCNATQGINPWHDASDIRPIIDFNNGNFTYSLNTDNYWYIANLDIKYSNWASYNNVFIIASQGNYFYNCIIRDFNNASGFGGVYVINSSNITFDTCEFNNNKYSGLTIYESADIYLYKCTFTYGANSQPYAIRIDSSFNIILKECTVPASMTTFYVWNTNRVTQAYLIDCNVALGGPSTEGYHHANKSFQQNRAGSGAIGLTDDRVYSNGCSTLRCGAGLADTTVREGGALSSAKITPNSTIGLYTWTSVNQELFFPDFRVWCPATETTITIYIKGFVWSTFPTASELYVETEYYSDDNPCTTSRVVSTQVLSNNTTWVAFTNTFTPYMASFANVKVKLKKYTASCGIYVDVLPVVS